MSNSRIITYKQHESRKLQMLCFGTLLITSRHSIRDAFGGGLSIVPGVSGGEGCSTAGGCASCPFMKMNDLDSLQDIVLRGGSGMAGLCTRYGMHQL